MSDHDGPCPMALVWSRNGLWFYWRCTRCGLISFPFGAREEEDG